MFSIFGDILCVLQNILLVVEYAGISLVNLLIMSLGGWLLIVTALLPSMPAVPASGASPEALGWLAWFYPVEAALAAFGTFLVCWGAFLACRIALRWSKAL